VRPEALQAAGAAQPWQAALLGCFWVAAKLEERRRGLPSASKVPFRLLFSASRVQMALKVALQGLGNSFHPYVVPPCCLLGQNI